MTGPFTTDDDFRYGAAGFECEKASRPGGGCFAHGDAGDGVRPGEGQHGPPIIKRKYECAVHKRADGKTASLL